MATVAEMPLVSDPVPTKKGKSRKALKQKKPSSNEANILAGSVIQSPFKENLEPQSQKKSNKTKGASKAKQQQQTEQSCFEKELLEMQEKLQKMTLEKEQTEEMLKQKEEELDARGKEHEKLQIELKKLQKMKEFKPTLNFPMVVPLMDKEEKKEKKRVDPSKKRPVPPYLLWCKDHWDEVKKANPNAEFKEMGNLLGAKWKTVSADEKKPYEEKYQAEKESYLKIVGMEKRENEAIRLLDEEQKQKTAMELLEQYIQFQQGAIVNENKKKKKEKDPLKPKQPLSAFFLFTNERRAALLAENKNVKEVAKITGEEWRNMTDTQKAPYEEMAMKRKEQYLQEMEVYKKMKDEEAAEHFKEEEELMKLKKQEALQLLKKKEKTENLIKKTKENRQKKKQKEDNVDPNKPKKPASSFFRFSREERKKLVEERPGINNSTINALISLKWKELSEEEKQVWNKEAAEAMEAYKKEMEEYNKNVAEKQNSNEKQ
ncbi:high mobility group B protein 13-like [Lycium barbarum]|uniref:high mobility group B protein 13-like n=1 Tax=Lycium barbarum TaxID=112863 RepID=UPI00293E9D45|nr:high mobility group B protein 13-like [Lycium barbarum]